MNNKDLEKLYIKYKNPVYNFIFRLVNDPELAMDVTQQTFLNVICDNVNETPSKSYFISIARNIFYQQNLVNNEVPIDSVNESIDFNFSNDQFNAIPISNALKTLRSNIESTLSSLTISCRELMILYFIENLSIIEIAEITNRLISDVKVHLHVTIINFEKCLIKRMKGNVAGSDNQCLVYEQIIKSCKNSILFGNNLKILNFHISNCSLCFNNKEQLKRTGVLLNLTPIFIAPKILDERLSNAIDMDFEPNKSCH